MLAALLYAAKAIGLNGNLEVLREEVIEVTLEYAHETCASTRHASHITSRFPPAFLTSTKVILLFETQTALQIMGTVKT